MLRRFIFFLVAVLLPGFARADQESHDRPKQVFAHYMGCFLYGNGIMVPGKQNERVIKYQLQGPSYLDQVGGSERDLPLVPDNYNVPLQVAADLEIRRAMRMGLDGFAVDVLAGEQHALDSVDALFAAAEAKKYPFQITFCLDNPSQNEEAIRYLISKHGNSPNLARRDGKVLFFGYRNQRIGPFHSPDLPPAAWDQSEGRAVYGEVAKAYEKAAGQPLYLVFGINGAVMGDNDINPSGCELDPDFWKDFVSQMSGNFGGFCAFFWGSKGYDLAAKALHAQGMDWGEPIWCQYESRYWATCRMKDGSDLLRERWDDAIANNASLIQMATWNDYNESTNFAPGTQTGYAFNGLAKVLIEKWKTGKMPEAKKDSVYLFYPPYPPGARVYPFNEFGPALSSHLEVLTYLTKPATVTLPGRGETWDAPAGLSVKKLDPKPGPVEVELTRDGDKVLSLTGREPITDHPFRAQHSLVAISSDDDQWWNDDFGPNVPKPMAWYADANGDGLPNWYKLVYFKKLDGIKASDKVPAGDARTNLDAYLGRSNPLQPVETPPAGSTWSLLDHPPGVSFNPECDAEGRQAWQYLYQPQGQETWQPLAYMKIPPPGPNDIMIAHRIGSANLLEPAPHPDNTEGAQIHYLWSRADKMSEWHRSLALLPVPGAPVAVEWAAPVTGTYRMSVVADMSSTSATGQADPSLRIADGAGKELWSGSIDASHPHATITVNASLQAGQILRLEATAGNSAGPIEVTQLQTDLVSVP